MYEAQDVLLQWRSGKITENYHFSPPLSFLLVPSFLHSFTLFTSLYYRTPASSLYSPAVSFVLSLSARLIVCQVHRCPFLETKSIWLLCCVCHMLICGRLPHYRHHLTHINLLFLQLCPPHTLHLSCSSSICLCFPQIGVTFFGHSFIL